MNRIKQILKLLLVVFSFIIIVIMKLGLFFIACIVLYAPYVWEIIKKKVRQYTYYR